MDTSADRNRLEALLSSAPPGLTPNQLSFWAWEQLEPGNPALILNTEWRLSHCTEAGLHRLHQALEVLYHRHEALHTRVSCPPGSSRPAPVACDQPLDFQVHWLESEADLQQELQQQACRPFWLEREAPFRVRLLRYPQGAHLLIQLHHLAADAWSIHILREEMVQLLEGRPLQPLPLNFSAYARWQQAWLKGSQARSWLEAWKAELASPRLDFRLTPPATAPSSPGWIRWKSHPLSIQPPLTRRLRHRASQGRCSLNAVLLAAYARALQRFSAREEVLIAVPGAARDRSAFRHLVGPLFSLLPLRLRPCGRDPGDFLQATAQALEAALQRQELPFLSLVEELKPRRSGQDFPLTGAAFSVLPYGHSQWTRLDFPDLQGEHVLHEFSLGPFEVTFNLLDQGDQLRAWMQYDPRRLTLAQVTCLCEALWEELDSPLPPAPSPPREGRLEEYFSARAPAWAGCTAVAAERDWSYAELDQWSNRLAGQLPGLSGSRVVGLQARPGAAAVAGWLAILKAGATVLPLDPALPEARRRQMVSEAGCTLVWDEPELASASARERADAPQPEQREPAAYLLYTSGSQGVPLGVLGSHPATLHRCQALQRLFPLEPGERVLLRTSIGFIDGLSEWFSALSQGATLVEYPAPPLPDPDHFLDFCSVHQIERLTLVPSWLGALLRSSRPWPESLKLCLVSGEPLRPDLVAQFRLRSRARLVNLYGSTECAGDVTWLDCSWLEPGAAEVPLGVPLGECRVWVGDEFGHPLPEGEEGEIWVAGVALALGYWRNPEAESQRFLPACQNLPRRLRTGDRGRWSAGLLEYRGRGDRQAKVRGWRVELAEVEARLESFPGVGQALARYDPDSQSLEAWVETPGPLNSAALWQHLQQGLPAAALPGQLRRVERFPRLASGKVDLQALHGQPLEPASASPATEPAWLPLLQCWQEVLQVPVGPHDNFFQLGGHSLRALELAERLSQQLGHSLAAGLLIEHPTVARLAEYLQQPRASAVVVMRAAVSAPLLALIPGAWGGTIGLRRLAEKLPDPLEVVGLEYEATDPQDQESLESLAWRFAQDLRRHRPQGRVQLCGYSLGGLLAAAMLGELGEQVEHLVLLDAYGPGLVASPGSAGQADYLARRMHELWTHARILARSRPRDLLERLLKIPQRWARNPSPQLELARDYLQRGMSLPGYTGRVTLIRLTHQPDWMRDPQLGWGALFPQLEIRDLLGLHGPLLLEEPLVSEAAHLLGEVVLGGFQDGAVASVSP